MTVDVTIITVFAIDWSVYNEDGNRKYYEDPSHNSENKIICKSDKSASQKLVFKSHIAMKLTKDWKTKRKKKDEHSETTLVQFCWNLLDRVTFSLEQMFKEEITATHTFYCNSEEGRLNFHLKKMFRAIFFKKHVLCHKFHNSQCFQKQLL